MVDSVMASGLQGVQRGVNNAQQAAQNIAETTTQPREQSNNVERAGSDERPSLEESIVELKTSERQVEASAQVVKTADDLLGTIVDISA